MDSIGVVVHLNYVDTAYARQAELVARLRELGVRHVRDAMPSPSSRWERASARLVRPASGPRSPPVT